jgi:hypothetical protein
MTLSITKPVVGGSLNSWGTVLNTALDTIVSTVNTNAATTNGLVNPVTFQIGGVTVSSNAGELNKLDGASITTAELNILDGDTVATSTSVAAGDRVVFNDAGTMKQVAMSDIASYIGTVSSAGTVTSVGVTVPTGLSVSPSSITSSGTFAISLASGYAIPTTSALASYNTAASYGNHANAGYLTSVAVSGSELSVSTSGSTATITHTPASSIDALNAVGSYAWLGKATAGTFTAGTAYNSSDLKFSGFQSTNAFNDNTAAAITGATPSGGTWRAMGTASFVSNRASSTLFIRIT